MGFLKRWLHLEDKSYNEKASETEAKISEAKMELTGKLQEINEEQHKAAFRAKSDKVLDTWGGAARLLRDEE